MSEEGKSLSKCQGSISLSLAESGTFHIFLYKTIIVIIIIIGTTTIVIVVVETKHFREEKKPCKEDF